MTGPYVSYETAEDACRAEGLTPFRVEFQSPQWGTVVGQVQSEETAPGTYGHPLFCGNVEATERPVTFVHDPGNGITHYVEIGDPIGGQTPMCLARRTVPGEGPSGKVCMYCRDARRRLLPNGEYRPTVRS